MIEEPLDNLSKIRDQLVAVEEEMNKFNLREPVVADLLTNLISMVTQRLVILEDADFYGCPDCDYSGVSKHALNTHIGSKHGKLR